MPTRIGAMTSSPGSRAWTATSKRTWSLPLPVQPWATASAPFARGDLDEQLGDERPGERGGQRVGALVQRVGLEVRPDEVGHEALARIHDVRAGRAGAIARASTPSRSEPPPRSTVSVTTSTPYCSRSQATATDVSSPPE